MRVSAIGSPIGKIGVQAPIGPELDRLRRIGDVAARLGVRIVRVFSFFIPPGDPPERYRQQVIDRMAALAGIAAERGLVLAHENEKEIFGDIPERCADLITSVGSPALRATFDAANFVQCGVRPFTEGYELLRPHLVYLQIKDALAADGRVVPAGKATGRCGKPSPRCGTRASTASCHSNRTWRRRAGSAGSAARKPSRAPHGH